MIASKERNQSTLSLQSQNTQLSEGCQSGIWRRAGNVGRIMTLKILRCCCGGFWARLEISNVDLKISFMKIGFQFAVRQSGKVEPCPRTYKVLSPVLFWTLAVRFALALTTPSNKHIQWVRGGFFHGLVAKMVHGRKSLDWSESTRRRVLVDEQESKTRASLKVERASHSAFQTASLIFDEITLCFKSMRSTYS